MKNCSAGKWRQMRAVLVAFKGKRGRGAVGKLPVFGLLKLGGQVFVPPIPDARSDTWIPVILMKIKPDSIV
jgi:transposase